MFTKTALSLLHLLPPEVAHKVALYGLDFCASVGISKRLWPADLPINTAKKVMGIKFPNYLGVAAGLDKNADHIKGLSSLGFGFIEVGTLTKKPQNGNPKPRLFRLTSQEALINRMGFNNKGVHYAIDKIAALEKRPIIGINIGKNAKTPNEDAAQDYNYCMDTVYEYADYITINISSPNTKKLRELQQANYLDKFLSSVKITHTELVKKYAKYVPLVVKISPDMETKDLDSLGSILLSYSIDGVITTNSTSSRSMLDPDMPHATETGGLSGTPLAIASTKSLEHLANIVQSKIAIIACGGIKCTQDVKDRMNAGADLIQIYTSFIYSGPAIIKELLEQ